MKLNESKGILDDFLLIDGNASKPQIIIFDENEIFTEIYFSYHSL